MKTRDQQKKCTIWILPNQLSCLREEKLPFNKFPVMFPSIISQMDRLIERSCLLFEQDIDEIAPHRSTSKYFRVIKQYKKVEKLTDYPSN
jgi:hypothetical protein